MYTRTGKNEIKEVCDDCKQVEDIGDLVENLENNMNKIGAMSGKYFLTNTQNSYEINFEFIVKDKRIDWDMQTGFYFDDKQITMYLKDQNIYVVYPNNGANIVVKDQLVDVVDEFEAALDELNASYDKENFPEIMTGDKLAGFNFETLKTIGEYVVNEDGTYTVSYVENDKKWEYDISSNFMFSEIRCEAINFTSKLVLEYPEKLEITYPMGLDFLTVDIEDVKKILEVDSLAELVDPNIKEQGEQSE